MTLDVHLFPCLSDNYGLLVRDRATGTVATIDTPDADRILEALDGLGWGRLDLILNTHWHPDHTGGNAALKAATGCMIHGPEEVRRAAPLDHVIADGDTVSVGKTRLQVTAAPGHTLGHVVLHDVEGRMAFVGDVLFTLGCGRLFEGTPDQMWTSLSALLEWPDETVIWCAHEYTAANARFALSLDDRPALNAHVEALMRQIEAGRPTVPTTIGVERRFNPFLTAGNATTFADRRAAKDSFRG
ncbi:MAG: hydroxyacylglutathione hydrolase [Alphaproteobacteria bacterium]|nr:hydroxyacylglutathione hydrolase [Alphaproteobacteria bacterium]